ncbi:glycosyltransferase [Spiribacter vilamensis]|uniref:Glycosyltransferase involved in cell wall biosynthesis n=2 Tax=Spiribacter vilamensis TaxID=531306 RepID=A0A4Q8D1G1_9GAMM|nr:glycosyltransferase [Spiribacter vilamensis]RZU99097.1 glycosyltransferase involved in cell wall biosynthesis [Spiribacter vilamensis]TVO61906.1 glycosyltransferase family 4 protein [Spiribacter vilamensis]
MLEPLGRSQVLSYLSRLSGEYAFTLVSFEKPADLADEDAVASLRAECAKYGIDWHPQVYHRCPRLLATAWDLLVLLWQTCRHSFNRDVRLVHCRSYIPAIAAWLCGRVTRKPFIFDMRALWPDEMVTAGRLARGSLTYRGLKWVERRLLRRAARVVSLTQAGVDYLLEIYPELPREKFEVITTCVDVDRFHVPAKQCSGMTLEDRSPFVVGTMGTLLSGWFYLNAFFAFFRAVKRLRPDARISIVTRDDHEKVLEAAWEAGVEPDEVDVCAASSREMPDLLAEMDVGVMFFAPKPGSAPTRLGEFLAAGVPVVGNTGIGDLGRLIESYGVGTVVNDTQDPSALDQAAHDLLARYDEILASSACRHAAEDYFSVGEGAKKYRHLYQTLTAESAGAETGQ